MKNTAFSGVSEVCDNNQTGCGNYFTYAEMIDHGNPWILYSLIYTNPSSAISETEILKNKAYSPVLIETGNTCIYFNGTTQDGARAIIAVPNMEYKGTDKKTAVLLKNRFIKKLNHMKPPVIS